MWSAFMIGIGAPLAPPPIPVAATRRHPNSTKPPATVDEWVAAFKQKRAEIGTNRCRS